MKRLILLFLVVFGCSSPTQHITITKNHDLALTILYNHILKWEGEGIVEDPDDRGGLTNTGLTYISYLHLKDRLHLPSFKELSKDDIKKCIKHYYYTYGGYKFNNPKVSVVITELYWGGNGVIREVADKLNLPLENIIKGYAISDTFANRINSLSLKEQDLFINVVLGIRENYFKRTCQKLPRQCKFLQGWLNRNNDLKLTLSNLIYHQVKKGDTLYSLSKQYNVSLESLKEINKGDLIKTNTIIYVMDQKNS